MQVVPRWQITYTYESTSDATDFRVHVVSASQIDDVLKWFGMMNHGPRQVSNLRVERIPEPEPYWQAG